LAYRESNAGLVPLERWHAPEEYAYRFPGLPNSFATIRPSTQSLSRKTGESYTLRASHARLGDNSRVVVSLDRKRRGADFWGRADVSIRGVFDKEAGRKPLAFVADAGYAAGTNYGIVAPTG